MSQFDIDELFRKFAILDAELKQLKAEVGEIKKNQFTPIGPIEFGHPRVLKVNKPAQWPNEPYTDYLKRIGEYNEAQTFEDDTK